jgi:putative oxidoreductase
MAARREGLRDAALLALRFSAGFMLFYLHGLDKLKGAYAHYAHGAEWGFPGHIASIGVPLATFAALFVTFAEGIASLFLAAGLFTRYAAMIVAAAMAGAVYYHAKTATKPELALIYMVIALLFVFHDPGRFALERFRRGRR